MDTLLLWLLLLSILPLGFYMAWLEKRRERSREERLRDLEANNRNLKVIQDLSMEINAILELDNLLPVVMDAFVKAGGVSKGSLMLLDEDSERLTIRASVGLSERAIAEVRPKLGEGVAGIVAQSGRPILVNDTTREALYKDYVVDELKERPRESLLCLPLPFRGKVVGCLNLSGKSSGDPFIRNDEVVLSILANQAAVAINNAYLYQQAITDSLTKLYLKRFFLTRLDEVLSSSVRYGRSVSLIMLDIDHFKNINDTMGHPIGDKVLVHLARLMQRTMRIPDICARYGGEEFAIIMPETSREQAALAARRLCQAMESYGWPISPTRKVTASLGVATTPFEEKDFSRDDLIRSADEMLYRAKQEGRNRVCILGGEGAK